MKNYKFSFIAISVFLSLMLTSCQINRNATVDPIDRSMDLSRDDYRQLTGGAKEKNKRKDYASNAHKKRSSVPPIPKTAPILAAPSSPNIKPSRQVSIAVSDDVPLKDVLLELARLADIDIEIDSGIEGGISFRAKDKPFDEVIERISNMAGLRYSMSSGVLRVERDIPYVHNYSLSFLNMVRSAQSSVNIATDVLSAASEGGSGGISTGSTSSISSNATDDFWTGLENAVSQILASAPISKLSDLSEGQNPQISQPNPTTGGSTGTFSGGAFYVVNRQAGMLSVSGSKKQHSMIKSYLDQIKASASAQVLIEAKIVEVSLNDEYRTGIDWSTLSDAADTNGVDISFAPSFPDATNLATARLGIDNFGIDLDAAVDLAESFGTTRTLSSPRLHAINNQAAVLTFAENRIFFEVDVEREDDTVTGDVIIPGSISVDSTRRSVPIGIILNILPSIDVERDEVTLNVRPTLSRQVGTVTDPGSALVNQLILEDGGGDASTFTNEVPIVEVRELDSILKLRSGQVMVIGGLMEQGSNNTEGGIPFASDVPLFGNLFKSVEKEDTIRELIIFIRATIVTPHGSHHKADERVYDIFTNDPRPIDF